ncbi:MAG TPA: LuxR C-terminal-related transcriptional regulator [Burkholderiaceae bacterium]|jgi:two-component system response regulator DctR
MLHIVDGEKATRDSISLLATSRGIAVSTYDSGKAFLDRIKNLDAFHSEGQCLLVDVRIPPLSGITLLYTLVTPLTTRNLMHQFSESLACYLGSSIATDNMFKGEALFFFERPYNENILMDRVEEALAASRKVATLGVISSQLAVLSIREKEILELILTGESNKVIGGKLGISHRTVEIHRANIFCKMQVKNAIELARILK